MILYELNAEKESKKSALLITSKQFTDSFEESFTPYHLRIIHNLNKRTKCSGLQYMDISTLLTSVNYEDKDHMTWTSS